MIVHGTMLGIHGWGRLVKAGDNEIDIITQVTNFIDQPGKRPLLKELQVMNVFQKQLTMFVFSTIATLIRQ